MFLFDLHSYIEELRENDNKKEIVESYERLVEPFEGKHIQDLRFYKEHYSKIKVIPYNVPVELKDDFDWDLLARLVIGSFSSDYSFELIDNDSNLPELMITVSSGDQNVTKTVSELWSFQILRLFEIYFEEAANLQRLKEEDVDELSVIKKERRLRLLSWKRQYSKLTSKYGNSEISKIKSELDKFIDL